MMNRLHAVFRRSAPFLGAGMLLQAGSCTTIDTNAIFTGLVTSIVNNWISSVVFGAFNVVGP